MPKRKKVRVVDQEVTTHKKGDLVDGVFYSIDQIRAMAEMIRLQIDHLKTQWSERMDDPSKKRYLQDLENKVWQCDKIINSHTKKS